MRNVVTQKMAAGHRLFADAYVFALLAALTQLRPKMFVFGIGENSEPWIPGIALRSDRE